MMVPHASKWNGEIKCYYPYRLSQLLIAGNMHAKHFLSLMLILTRIILNYILHKKLYVTPHRKQSASIKRTIRQIQCLFLWKQNKKKNDFIGQISDISVLKRQVCTSNCNIQRLTPEQLLVMFLDTLAQPKLQSDIDTYLVSY